MWRSLFPFTVLAVAVAVAAPVPTPSGKLAPIPAPDADAADYDKPPKGALLRLGSRQMRHPQGYVGDYAADGRTLFTAGPGRICEWDTDSSTLRRVFSLSDKVVVHQAGCTPDGRLVLVKEIDTLRVFDRATKKQLHALKPPNQAVGCFAASPDSKYVAVSTSDNCVRQYDLENGKLLDFTASHPLPGPTIEEIEDPKLPRRKDLPTIYSLAWSPDGKTIASCSMGQGVMAWNSLTGEERWSFDTGKAYGKIAFTADGKHLLAPLNVGLRDALVRLDAATGEKGDELAGFSAPHGLAASADGRFLCNGKAMWDVKADKRITTSLPNYWSKGLALSPDGKRAAVAPDGLRVFDTATGKELFDDTGHPDELTTLAVSPDAKQAATGGKDWTVRLWDATTGKQVKVLSRNREEPLAMAYSPDGKHLAVAVRSGLRVYDPSIGQEVWTAGGFDYGGKHLAYSPDGKTLALGALGLAVHLFDAATGKVGRTLVGDSNFANFEFRFAWTPDSTGIVAPAKLMPKPKGGQAAEADGKFRVVLWDVKAGERVRTLGEPAQTQPSTIAISPDGKHVAIGGKALSFVEWKTGKEKWTTDVTADYGLAFDGDDHLYADGVRLDTSTGKKDGGLKIDPKTLRALVVPPKGKTVLTASADDNTVVVWPR